MPFLKFLQLEIFGMAKCNILGVMCPEPYLTCEIASKATWSCIWAVSLSLYLSELLLTVLTIVRDALLSPPPSDPLVSGIYKTKVVTFIG